MAAGQASREIRMNDQLLNGRFDPVYSARPTSIPIPTDHYSGVELSRTCQRPGAYDAFACPSVDVDGVRRPYRFSLTSK